MKINDQVNEVSSNLTQGANDMTIDAEGMTHIISILTNLYEDPEKTVIREYYSNALDSHIASGTEEKIEVIAPSFYDPTFVVQDYGIGMSEHDILSIYSSYGKSTKRDSNDQVGAFGLGCKSALSYANQFSVEAVKDGNKTLALIARKDNGGSECTIVGTSATDDPNGVRISIPVSDKVSFHQKMEKFFKYADPTRFDLEGLGVDYFKDTYSSITDNLWVSDHSHFDPASLSVIMGGVQYPVSTSFTSTLFSDSGLNFSYGTDLLIEVPIGDVDLTPSRESMQETERTTTNVRNQFEHLISEMYKTIQTKVDEEENVILAKARVVAELFNYGMINRNSYQMSRDFEKFKNVFNFQGEDIDSFTLKMIDNSDTPDRRTHVFRYNDEYFANKPQKLVSQGYGDFEVSNHLMREFLLVDTNVQKATFDRWAEREYDVSAWDYTSAYPITEGAKLTEEGELLNFKRISFDEYKTAIKKEEAKLNARPKKVVSRTDAENAAILRNTDVFLISEMEITRMNVNDLDLGDKYITLRSPLSKADFRAKDFHVRGISWDYMGAIVANSDIVSAISSLTEYDIVILPQWFSDSKIPKNTDLAVHHFGRENLMDFFMKNFSRSKKKRDILEDIMSASYDVDVLLSEEFLGQKFSDPKFKKVQHLIKVLSEEEREAIRDSGLIRHRSSWATSGKFAEFMKYVDNEYGILSRSFSNRHFETTKGLAKMFNIMYTDNIKEEK